MVKKVEQRSARVGVSYLECHLWPPGGHHCRPIIIIVLLPMMIKRRRQRRGGVVIVNMRTMMTILPSLEKWKTSVTKEWRGSVEQFRGQRIGTNMVIAYHEQDKNVFNGMKRVVQSFHDRRRSGFNGEFWHL